MTIWGRYALKSWTFTAECIQNLVMEFYAKIVNGFQVLTIFGEDSVLYVWQGSKYASLLYLSRSSPPEVFLGNGALKICSKFTRERPCRSAISIKLLCSTPFPKNSSGGLLLPCPWFLHYHRILQWNFDGNNYSQVFHKKVFWKVPQKVSKSFLGHSEAAARKCS